MGGISVVLIYLLLISCIGLDVFTTVYNENNNLNLDNGTKYLTKKLNFGTQITNNVCKVLLKNINV